MTGMLSLEVLLLCRTFRLRESDPFLDRFEMPFEKPEMLERLIERRRAGIGDPGRESSQRELERSPNEDPKEKAEDEEVMEKKDVAP